MTDEVWGEAEHKGPGRNSSPRKRSSGTGYGLARPVEITERLAGEIEVERLLFALTYIVGSAFFKEALRIGQSVSIATFR